MGLLQRLPARLAMLGLLLSFASLAAADSGAGSFTYSGTTFTVTDAIAFLEPSPFDEEKTLRVLVFSTVPLERGAIRDALDPGDAVSSQISEQGGSSVSASLDEDGNVTSLNFSMRSEGSMNSFSVSGTSAGHFNLCTETASRLAGNGRGRDSGSDPQWTFEVTYDLELPKPLPPGDPLPKGGGDAGKAYVAYIAAVQKGDLQKAARYMPAEQAEKFLAAQKEPDFKEMFEMFKAFKPKSVVVNGGFLKKERATLDVVGKDADGNRMEGRVRMKKDGKQWRVESEDLTTKVQ